MDAPMRWAMVPTTPTMIPETRSTRNRPQIGDGMTMASVAHRAPRLDSTHTYHAIASSVASYPLLSLTNLKRKKEIREDTYLFFMEAITESLVILSVVLSTLLGAPLVPILTAEDDLAHADGLRE